jgi:two-component system nitrate/nitrite response regulator NarL
MRLALCDDQQLFMESLAHAMEHRGHQVVVLTGNVDVLLDAVRDNPPQVCLLGVGPNQAPRVDVAAEVRRRAPETRIVLLTGDCGDVVWSAYDQRIVDAIVNKTLPLDSAEDAANSVVRQQRVVLGWSRPGGQRKRDPADELTGREHEVLALIVDGLSTEGMAAKLGVSANTVRTHVQSVLRKFGVNSREKAAAAALQMRTGR